MDISNPERSMKYTLSFPSITQTRKKFRSGSKLRATNDESEILDAKFVTKLIKDYVLPSIDTNAETPPLGDELFTESNQENSGYLKSCSSRMNSVSVLHEKLVYSSARRSKEILDKNKKLYEQMHNIMKKKERNDLRAAIYSCKHEQDQLKFFTHRSRVTKLPDKGIN